MEHVVACDATRKRGKSRVSTLVGLLSSNLLMKIQRFFEEWSLREAYRKLSPNISTTPLRQWGFQQCLPFSWITLRGKHCRHPIAVIVVVDTFGQGVLCMLLLFYLHPALQLCRPEQRTLLDNLIINVQPYLSNSLPMSEVCIFCSKIQRNWKIMSISCGLVRIYELISSMWNIHTILKLYTKK